MELDGEVGSSHEQMLSPLSAEDMEARVRDVFGLNSDEVFLGEFPCWLAKGALLKGNLYLTNKHLLFYSFIHDDENDDEVQKEGYMSKKTVKEKLIGFPRLSHNHWFELRSSELWYSENSQKASKPLGVIDLRFVKAIEPSMMGSSKFTMTLVDRTLEFDAGSFVGMLEWTKAIQSVLFKIQNDGNNIKIVAPLSEVTECSLSPYFGLTESIHLTVSAADNEEEYFFTHFKDAKAAFDLIHAQVRSAPRRQSEAAEETKLRSDSRWSLFSLLPLLLPVQGTTPPSSSPSPLNTNGDPQDQFCSTFKLDEKILGSYQATYSNQCKHPGILFITENHLAFKLSNNSIKQANILIDFLEVRKVKKPSLGIFFHHSFTVKTFDGREFVFDTNSERDSQEASDLVTSLVQQAREIGLSSPPSPPCTPPSPTSAAPEIPGFDSSDSDSNILLPDDFPLSTISSANNALDQNPRIETITLLTIGSRGDVQPMVVFAKKLMKEGHKVRIATHEEFRKWVEGFGIEFRPIKGDPTVLLGLMAQHTFLSPNFVKRGFNMFQEWFDTLLESSFVACLGSDCIIASPYSFVGYHIAESMNIPLFNFCPFPWIRTKAFPHPLLSYDFAPERLNFVSYTIFDSVLWGVSSLKINSWRKKTLSLKPISIKDDTKTPTINCFDQTFVPLPPDWPDWVHTCGFFFLDDSQPDWTPPPKLVEFLEKGDNKVVFLGFGSIVVDDAEKMMNILVEATKKANVRAVISRGWSSRGERKGRSSSGSGNVLLNRPAHVYEVDGIPHSWIFPRVHAVVHHGGAGTTAAGLRAMKPTVIKPFFGDQYFWGDQVDKFGAGVLCKELTVDKLAAAIIEVTTNESIIQAAASLGKKIMETNGPEKAYSYFLRDLKLAKKVVAERHASNSMGETTAHLKNVIFKLREEKRQLRKENEQLLARIRELEEMQSTSVRAN